MPSVPATWDAIATTPRTRVGSSAATVKQGLPPKDQPTTRNFWAPYFSCRWSNAARMSAVQVFVSAGMR